jgi:hypothetical protein
MSDANAYTGLSDRLARHLYHDEKYKMSDAVEVAGKIAYLLSETGPYFNGSTDEFEAKYRDRARTFSALLTKIADEG